MSERHATSPYVTKDSGERASFGSGMVRDTQTGKPRYGLIPLGPLKRLAELYARGAEKYDARNWEKADSVDELERFRESAFRHLMQLLDGETDEDHGAAVVFNVFAIMWLEARLAAAPADAGYHYRPDGKLVTIDDVVAVYGTTCPSCGALVEAPHEPGCRYLADRRRVDL